MELEKQFSYITTLIKEAKQRAYHAVNFELIKLYWQELENMLANKYPVKHRVNRLFKNYQILSRNPNQILLDFHLKIFGE